MPWMMRTHVAERSADGRGDTVAVAFAEAKISQFNDVWGLLATQQHIFQFYVPVGHAHFVAVVHCQ